MFTVRLTVKKHMIISQHCRATWNSYRLSQSFCSVCLKHFSTFKFILSFTFTISTDRITFDWSLLPNRSHTEMHLSSLLWLLRWRQVLRWSDLRSAPSEDVKLLILQFSQALLQALNVCVPLLTLAATGAALQELHLHGQLAELEVLSFLSQIQIAAHRAILRAESCWASHSQGVPVWKWDVSVEASSFAHCPINLNDHC